MLQDPLKGIGKLIEDKRGRAEAKRKYTIIVVLGVPIDAQQVPVSWADRAKSECTTYIDLSEKGAGSLGHNC